MKRLLLKILALCAPVYVSANVVLPSVFSDNMVVQRNAPVKLWGWSHPNEEITITTSWDNKEYKIKGSNQAIWNLTVQTPGAGGPYTVRFKGYNEIILNNVMLGEVWLCSGQSNMEWTPNAGITGGEVEIAKANYPNIRFFSVPKLTAKYPQDNLPGSWQECTPETMKHFSAIGYFFAQRLQEDLKGIAIGVINSSWGGTPAEIWFPKDYITKDTTLSEAAAKLKPSEWGPHEPGRAWNAMVNPLAGFRIAGALWYQGESNVGSEVYNKTLGGLITSWRQAWDYDFPFYFVQIAPYNYDGNPDADWGVKVRDAQRRVLNEVPNTAMAVISDVGNVTDIHPRDKKPVGIRLANIALSKIYATNKALSESPLYKDFSVKGDKLAVHFNNAQGLHFEGKTSTLFEVAGTDGKFYPATAKIEKDSVIVTAKAVKNPVKVRYGWKNAAVSDLYNSANLPASPFTSE